MDVLDNDIANNQQLSRRCAIDMNVGRIAVILLLGWDLSQQILFSYEMYCQKHLVNYVQLVVLAPRLIVILFELVLLIWSYYRPLRALNILSVMFVLQFLFSICFFTYMALHDRFKISFILMGGLSIHILVTILIIRAAATARKYERLQHEIQRSIEQF